MNCRQSSTVGSSGTSWPRLEYSIKILPRGLVAESERKTSPHAQWKKFGMLPRILPWVPLPAPGAPKSRIVRYFMLVGLPRVRCRRGGGSGIFMLQLNFLDFAKGNGD